METIHILRAKTLPFSDIAGVLVLLFSSPFLIPRLRATHRISAVKALIACAVADGDGTADIARRRIILEMLKLRVVI